MEKTRILLIDDEPTFVEVIGTYLEISGYEVSSAENGKAGVQKAAEIKPDLVLVDLEMPVMDGFKTVAEMKKDQALKDIPVIFLTSHDRFNLKVKGLEMGAEDYLVKPVNQPELLARIKTVLRRSARSGNVGASLKGDLSDMNLFEVLSAMENGAKTGILEMKEMQAAVYIEGGRMAQAVFRNFTGIDALRRVFYKEKGSFIVLFKPLPEGLPPERLSLSNRMLEDITYLDELKHEMESLPADDAHLAASPGLSDFPAVDKYRAAFPIRPSDLLVMMEGDLKENAALITEAYKRGALVAA